MIRGVGVGRLGAVLIGVGLASYGGYRLLELGFDNLLATTTWLAAGVAMHDGVLAPLTIAVCGVGVALLPGPWRAAAAGGLLVLGTLTLVAVPVLGRFGARPDNPTLLDRHYWLGWWAVAGVVGLGVLLAGLRRGRRRPG